MANKLQTVAINVYSVKKDDDTNAYYLDWTTRDYAAPANVVNLPAFVSAVENIQLNTLYRKFAARYESAKDGATKKQYNGALTEIAAHVTMEDAAINTARYTVAGMVAYSFFSACRGKIDTAEIIPTGASALYDAAARALDAANKNEIDAARRDIHAAITYMVENFSANENDSDFSKVWRARVKKHHVDAAIAAANSTRTTYSARGIKTRAAKISDVAKEVIALVLRDCFHFTDIVEVKTVKF